jgi:hypothetical protein
VCGNLATRGPSPAVGDARHNNQLHILCLKKFTKYYGMTFFFLAKTCQLCCFSHFLLIDLEIVLVMKELSTFGQNGSGTKFHYNEITSYLNLFVPGKLMGFFTTKETKKLQLLCYTRH